MGNGLKDFTLTNVDKAPLDEIMRCRIYDHCGGSLWIIGSSPGYSFFPGSRLRLCMFER